MSQKFKSDIETQAGLIDSFGFSGSAGQILSSTGTKTEWITPPQSPGGGGSSQVFYFNGGTASSVGGYYQMSPVANTSTGADFTINANGYIASFLTDVNSPNQLNIPAGNWNFEIYFSASSGGGSPSFYVELYKYSSSTFTLIASSSATPEGITNGTAIDLYITALAVPTTTLLATDRLAVRVYVTHSGRTIKMHTQNGHLSEVITTFSTGLTALNGLTEQVQYFATGAGGTDFNIASAVNTHTFNLPTASATNRGALSSADWTTFNSKANASGTTNYVAKFTGTSALGNSLVYDNGTNVGIGTTSPAYKLQVAGNSFFESGFSTYTADGLFSANARPGVWTKTPGGTDRGVRLGYRDFGSGEYFGRLGFVGISNWSTGIANFAGTSFSIGLNNATATDYLTITDTGNVGIGTSNPTAKLTVLNASSTTAALFGGGVASPAWVSMGTVDSGAAPFIQGISNSLASNTNLILNPSGGNIGIGTTTPGARIDVVGSFDALPARILRQATYGEILRIGRNGVSESASINYPADGVFAINTASTERMRITAAGNVGIGTSAPNAKLEVSAGQSFINQDYLLGWNVAGSATLRAYIIGTSGNELQFWNRQGGTNTQAITLNATGNVGIGATSPVSIGTGITTLDIQGSAAGGIAFGLSGTKNYIYGASTMYVEAHTTAVFATSGSEKMRITSGGNVGIGTTNPYSPLQVGSYTGTGGFTYGIVASFVGAFNSVRPTLFIGSTDTTSTQNKGGSLDFGGGSEAGSTPYTFARIKGFKENPGADYSGYLSFSTTPSGSDANTERMRITSTGNVGIGTTSPSDKLTINSGGSGTGLKIEGYQAENFINLNNVLSTGNRTFRLIAGITSVGYDGFSIFDTVANDTRFVINNSGNVGIGTNAPNTKLEVIGSTKISQSLTIGTGGNYEAGSIYSDGNWGMIFRARQASPTNAQFMWADSLDNELMRIKDGKVGIGISNPNSKLEVLDGDISVTTANSFSFLNSNRNFIPNTGGVSLGALRFRGYSTGTTYQVGSAIYSFSQDAWTSTSTPGYLSFQTTTSGSISPSEKMVISSSGAARLNSYGSGTFTGTATQKLAVDSSGNIIEIPIGAGPVDGSGTTNYVTKWTDADTIGNSIMFDNGTNIGIGTTSPQNKLQIGTMLGYSTNAFAIGNGSIDFAIYQDTSLTQFYTSGGFLFATNSTEKMRITSSGNVGIGTTSPNAKLNVVTTGDKSTISIGDTAASTYSQLLMYGGGGGAPKFNWSLGAQYNVNNAFEITPSTVAGGTTFSTPAFLVTSGGNVGIGTSSPAYKLVVQKTDIATPAIMIGGGFYGGPRLQVYGLDDNATAWMGLGTDMSGGIYEHSIYFPNASGNGRLSIGNYNGTTYSEKMCVINSGNVGIGTTSPSAKLQVNGSIFVGDGSGGSGTPTQSVFQDTYGGNREAIYVKNTADYTGGRGSGYGFLSGAGTERGYIRWSADDASQTGYFITLGTTNSSGSLIAPLTLYSSGAAAFSSSVTAAQFKTPGFVEPTSVKGLFNNTNYSGPGWDNASLVTGNGATGVMMGGDTASYTYGWIQGVQTDNGANKNLILEPLGGNVGIGNSTPAAPLSFANLTGNKIDFYYDNVSGGDRYGIEVQSSELRIHSGAQGDPLGGITFGKKTATTFTEAMRVANNGNVGIGTSSPGQKLQVDGSLLVNSGTNTATAYRDIMIGGIGGWVPGESHCIDAVYSSAGSPTTFSRIESFFDGTSGKIRFRNLFNASTPNTNILMTIQGNGNVGIGTDSPGAKLQVGAYLQLESSANYPGMIGLNRNVNTGAILNSSYGAYQLQNYEGTLVLQVYASDGTLETEHSFFNDGKTCFGGSVGINVTNPTKALDVNGDALISGLTIGVGGGGSGSNTALGKNALLSNTTGNYSTAVGLYALENSETGMYNVAVGSFALTNNVSGSSCVAIGYGAGGASNATGLTVIGANLALDTNLNNLGKDCLAISQFNGNATTAQVPHIYAPEPVNVGAEVDTDIITFDIDHYAGAIIEYMIRLDDGGDYAVGTVYMGWKSSGSGNMKDVRQIEWSNMSGFDFLQNGNSTLTLRNTTTNSAWIRITVRGMMTN
jgi:hypothetical protein